MKISPDTPISAIMSPDVKTVSASADLKQAWEILASNRISGAPVIDEQGEAIGVVSQHDLLQCIVSERSERLDEGSFYQALPAIAEGFFPSGDRVEEVLRLTAREVMNPRIIAVSPNDSVRAVAAVLRRNRVHRVLVRVERKIVGVVSTYDLLAIFDE